MGRSSMILIDTNYLIDFILPPYDTEAESRHTKAKALLSGIEDGRYRAIMPEVVLHECFYVLVTRLEVIDVATFSELFQSILQYRGWRLGDEETTVYLRALDIVVATPRLELSDALIAARAEYHGAELATFDKRLASAYGGKTWSES